MTKHTISDLDAAGSCVCMYCEVWLVDFKDGLVTRHCGHAVKFVLHAV